MEYQGNARRYQWILLLTVMVALLAACAKDGPTKGEFREKIAAMKGITVSQDDAENESTNQRLDEVWKFLRDNKNYALPRLAKELKKELKASRPDDYFLLDAGHFLFLEGDKSQRELAIQALLKLNPNSPVVQASFTQLFHFAYDVAKTGERRMLPLIDDTFVPGDRQVNLPEHAMLLTPALQCVFLYGVYGPDVAQHLAKQLTERPAQRLCLLEVLNYLGTVDCLEAVKATMSAFPDVKTYSLSLRFFTMIGGPQGKETILTTDMRAFDEEARELFEKAKLEIESLSYLMLTGELDRMGVGARQLSGEVLKERLEKMYMNYGVDDETNPLAIVNSDLPKDYLIAELLKIRGRMCHRLSDEGLQDVLVSNLIVSALLYRPD